MYDELIKVHKGLSDYFDACVRGEKIEQDRKGSHQGNIWDSKYRDETHLRSNEKGEKGRSSKVERSIK